MSVLTDVLPEALGVALFFLPVYLKARGFKLPQLFNRQPPMAKRNK